MAATIGLQETFTTFQGPVVSRADFQRVCLSLLRPLDPLFSPGCTRVRVGATGTRYDESGAQLEGYARPLWGLAAFLAGGGEYEDAWRWTEGLKNGTDPEHEEFWGWSRDTDQRMVEMCPIGFGLAVAGKALWDGLAQKDRDNIGKWLRWINDKENGAEYDAERMEKDMVHLDTFYRGDGWSNDGPRGYTQMDSYSGSYAIQYLQLLYAKLNGEKDPERARIFKERARVFAPDAVKYYDEQGRHITFGRSLTYRFAMAGFWSAVAFADVELPAPLSWGVVKGLLLRSCRWWMGQKDILTPQGTLSIGYCYPNQFLSENYNSPGSPYWFMLSFASLACPEDHPFWTAVEEPYPSAHLPLIKPLHQPLHITVCSGGHTFLLSSGQMCHYPVRAGAAKYGKFAYSSAFGYSVPTGEYFIEAVGGDNTIALSDDVTDSFGESWRTRRVAIDARIETTEEAPVLVSGWKPWHDVSVDTWLIPPTEKWPNWHLRVHHIKTGRNIRAVEGAWAIYGYRNSDGRELDVFTTDADEEGRIQSPSESCAASLPSGAVGIADISRRAARDGKVLDADANGNLIHNRTVLPTLFSDLKSGEEQWYVTAVFAVPESAEKWQSSWRASWENKPDIPQWVVKLIEA